MAVGSRSGANSKRRRHAPSQTRSRLFRILPRALVAIAVLCAAYSVYDCHFAGRGSGLSRREYLALFLRQLEHADPAMAVAAARSLGELGDSRAIEPLRAKLRDPSPEIAGAACAALGRLGDQTTAETALQMLQEDDSAALQGAASCLGDLRAAQAVPSLARLLSSGDLLVRLAAIRALGQIADPNALPELDKRRQALTGADLSEDERAEETQALDEATQAMQQPK